MLLRKDRRVKQLAMEKDMPIDRFWREVGALKTGEDFLYKLVSRLAAVMLVIPHSNAPPERIFCMINKNLSKERSRLNKDTTLNNIMIIKTSSPPPLLPTYPGFTHKSQTGNQMYALWH